MCKNDFNWDVSKWDFDFAHIFENIKHSLQGACAIFYPDYDLEWILRTDASTVGVGAVLFQIFIDSNGVSVNQPIGFASQKFSGPATRWSTFEQEAYGIYFGVKYFAYYLHCKHFILETDHNNLIWIEASIVPKIIRWRVYLQSFSFLLRHISGVNNKVADWQSRMFLLLNDSSSGEEGGRVTAVNYFSLLEGPIQSALEACHNSRVGHNGVRKTWNILNQNFPGNLIPYAVVAEFVATCPICQKVRLGMVDSLKPIVRHLKPEHKRSVVGVDTLTVTPMDKFGNQYIDVLVNHSTKFVVLYPKSEHTAISMATSIFQFFCTYGMFDSIISDPGSDLTSEVIKHLTD
jgi:hypothetical protein